MELDGRYRLDRVTGTGGTAEIWHGADRLLHRPVAVRIPHLSAADVTDRFLTGGRIAARLVHANIAAVYDVGVVDLPERGSTPYVVMELAEGPSLDVLLDEGALSWREAARIGAQVAAALAHAHGQWVTHGGLTPAKILLGELGAKVVGFAGDGEFEPAAAAADVRALGGVLAGCVGGQVGDGAPAELFELVDRCLRVDAAERPSSDEVALILAELSGTTVDLPAWLSEAAESRRTAVLANLRPDAHHADRRSRAARLSRSLRSGSSALADRFGNAARAMRSERAARAGRAGTPEDLIRPAGDLAWATDPGRPVAGRPDLDLDLAHSNADDAIVIRTAAAPAEEHTHPVQPAIRRPDFVRSAADRSDLARLVAERSGRAAQAGPPAVEAPGPARQPRHAADEETRPLLVAPRRPAAARSRAVATAAGAGAGAGILARTGLVGDGGLNGSLRAFGDWMHEQAGRFRSRRWALRTGAVTAGVAVVLAGAVGALGSSGTGMVPWLGRSPEVAAVPPVDTPPTGQDVAPPATAGPTGEAPRPTPTIASTGKNRPVTSTTGPGHPAPPPPSVPPIESSASPTTSASPSASASPTVSASPTGSPEPTGSAEPSEPPASSPAEVVSAPPAGAGPNATTGPPPGFVETSG
ncbi:protein kinase domain-containing protein [Dactylosporangium sp. CA-052675]|uniref:protein kinase domain-containing protein n=1 Tax=Dactylosporangium sp. CA-052675 TaxID=3239927 RepID=UPI003D8ED226